jgi:uncharacterized tellurite resistance protein B-like protein
MSNFERGQLESVFAYHVVQSLVGADNLLTDSEVAFLQATYPLDQMVSDGFALETGELTDSFSAARSEALRWLPELLDLPQKLALVSTFMDACLVDGHLDRSESSMLVQASGLLGITPDEFDAHLDTMSSVGSIELPEPEFEEP